MFSRVALVFELALAFLAAISCCGGGSSPNCTVASARVINFGSTVGDSGGDMRWAAGLGTVLKNRSRRTLLRAHVVQKGIQIRLQGFLPLLDDRLTKIVEPPLVRQAKLNALPPTAFPQLAV